MESTIRERTGCSIIAVKRHEQMIISPPPDLELEKIDELIIIGTVENEKLIQSL